jgi:hypothetical protein
MKKFTSLDRAKIIDDLIDDESKIIKTKGREYAVGAEDSNEIDPLANFNEVGNLVKHKCSSCGTLEPIGPQRVLAVYYMKQVLLSSCCWIFRSEDMSENLHSKYLITGFTHVVGCIHEGRSIMGILRRHR